MASTASQDSLPDWDSRLRLRPCHDKSTTRKQKDEDELDKQWHSKGRQSAGKHLQNTEKIQRWPMVVVRWMIWEASTLTSMSGLVSALLFVLTWLLQNVRLFRAAKKNVSDGMEFFTPLSP